MPITYRKRAFLCRNTNSYLSCDIEKSDPFSGFNITIADCSNSITLMGYFGIKRDLKKIEKLRDMVDDFYKKCKKQSQPIIAYQKKKESERKKKNKQSKKKGKYGKVKTSIKE